MRVSQSVVAAAIVISGVIADFNDDHAEQESYNGQSLSSSQSEYPTSQPKSTPPQSQLKPAPEKPQTHIQKALGTVSKLSNMFSGKVERTKERKAKTGAKYLKAQKLEHEIETDATGTKQPASLSNPNVDFMEAWTDLLKRYKGVANPNVDQFREDVKTVFESRAEKGDLTTKHFRQGYKVYKSKGPGIGKRATTKDKKTTGKDKRNADDDLEVRAAEPEAELDIEAREAEPEAEPIADPEAEVYADAGLFQREASDELEIVERDITADYDSIISRDVDDDDGDEEPRDPGEPDSEDSDDELKKDPDAEDFENDDNAASKKKTALKKKLSAKRKAAALKRKLLAKKKALAQRKKAAAKKAKSKAALYFGSDFDEDFEATDYPKPSSKATNRNRILRLKAALLRAQAKLSLAEDEALTKGYISPAAYREMVFSNQGLFRQVNKNNYRYPAWPGSSSASANHAAEVASGQWTPPSEAQREKAEKEKKEREEKEKKDREEKDRREKERVKADEGKKREQDAKGKVFEGLRRVAEKKARRDLGWDGEDIWEW